MLPQKVVNGMISLRPKEDREQSQANNFTNTQSSDLLGPRASRPQTRQGREVFPPNPSSRFALIAGGTPAVPANHLTQHSQNCAA